METHKVLLEEAIKEDMPLHTAVDEGIVQARRPGLRLWQKAAIGVLGAATILGYGSCRNQSGINEGIAKATATPYVVTAEEDALYLQNTNEGTAIKFDDQSWKVLDTYNRNPKAMNAAIAVINHLPGGD